MISILIPWRSNDPHRIAVWDYLRPRWEALDVELCTTDDGRAGRFSYAAGANRCRQIATGDILVTFGADHLPPTAAKLEWIRQRLEAMPWTGVYASTSVFDQWTTRLILGGHPPETLGGDVHAPVAMGIVAVRPDVWDDIGGMDERFIGWGAEDVALRMALKALHPAGDDNGEGVSHTLWHAPQPWDELTTNNNRLVTEYQIAAQSGRLRNYLADRRPTWQ